MPQDLWVSLISFHCPRCGVLMHVIALIEKPDIIETRLYGRQLGRVNE